MAYIALHLKRAKLETILEDRNKKRDIQGLRVYKPEGSPSPYLIALVYERGDCYKFTDDTENKAIWDKLEISISRISKSQYRKDEPDRIYGAPGGAGSFNSTDEFAHWPDNHDDDTPGAVYFDKGFLMQLIKRNESVEYLTLSGATCSYQYGNRLPDASSNNEYKSVEFGTLKIETYEEGGMEGVFAINMKIPTVLFGVACPPFWIGDEDC